MATQAEIIQRVGEDLGLVPIGQDLENQYQARIEAAYDEVYEKLKERGLASWASTADVPTKLVPSVALMIAEKLIISLSVPDTRAQRISDAAGPDGILALEKLATLAVPEYNPTEDAVDF